MGVHDLSLRVKKSVNKAIATNLDRIGGLVVDGYTKYDGVYISKNDAVVIDCFIEATIGRIPEYSKPLEEVEGWKNQLDTEDTNGVSDHIKAGKALKYTINCIKKGKDPDPEKIFKLGGFMDE